ncbi:MAG: hypothetical protein KDB79_06320, partial [Acidobacteria bacterium]|nr:hypothetical protein [Acidobacteriota bacterium]
GILENGAMPFGDMPFLFYFYAFLARILMLFGVEMNPAIVNSTRLVMSIVPALTAIPIYAFFRSLNEKRTLTIWHWCLVFVGAFIPLSLTHMPELLQKNALGLMLFTTLIASIYGALKEFSYKKLAIIVVLTLLIMLTHLGSLVAAGLFAVALTVSLFAVEKTSKRSLTAAASVLVLVAASLLAIFFYDPARFDRIFVFLTSSLSNSLFGLLFSGSAFSVKLQLLAAIILPLGIVYFLYRIWKSAADSTSKADKIFWLTNIIFCYLIVSPFADTDVVPRLFLFIMVPIIVILGFHFKYQNRRWLNVGAALILTLTSLVMAFGEVMGIVMRNADQKAAQAQILALKNKHDFSPNDLIITKYGVTEIANWFFTTKSTLITSLEKSDFEKYGKVYVLNPIEGSVISDARDENTDIGYKTDAEKYRLSRRNIIVRPFLKPVFTSHHFELFEIGTPPENWKFDESGKWIGYTKVK